MGHGLLKNGAAAGIIWMCVATCVNSVMGAADARVVQPFQLTRMFFGTALGYFLFLGSHDFWTWVGAAVIIFATYVILWHEGRVENATGKGLAAGGVV